MGKLHCDHRVVTRDKNDRIIRETSHAHFAEAKPVFDARKDELNTDEVLTLQHGARVIFRADGRSSNKFQQIAQKSEKSGEPPEEPARAL